MLRLDGSNLGRVDRAVPQEFGREFDYLPVAADGAARAAESIAELL